MYPTLFRLGDFEVTTFGAMVAVGALAGLWLLRRELLVRKLPEAAFDVAIIGLIAGIAGAKLLWTFEHLGEAPLQDLLFSRGGMSWFGGLLGGIGTAVVVARRRGLRLMPLLGAATPALALGHMFGRIGCFLVGDDYGRPTDLPWGVAFPVGLPPTDVPVHPTQLYEAAFLAVLTLLLIGWRRAGAPDRVLLARYLILAGAARFAIEFIRINEVVFLGLTLAHWIALGLIVAGVIVGVGGREKRQRSS